MSAPDVLKSKTFAADRRTWLVTIVLAALVWGGASAWLHRRVPFAHRTPAAADSDGRFVVLAFDRIVPQPEARRLDRARLRSTLKAIAADGWQPVTLREMHEAFEGGKPLPAHPVLITFDEGYLTTYEAADPVLRELHWPAVMFLRTDRQEGRDVSYLFWDRLERMVSSGLWEVASGDPPPRDVRAGQPIPQSPPGVALIAERLSGRHTPAWAPRGLEPLPALGIVDRALPVASPAHAVPWLGFVDDVAAGTDPSSSPFRISRLRVRPEWSVAELLHHMHLAVEDPPSESADPAAANDARSRPWVPGEGTVQERGGAAVLRGAPRADVWIPSTRWVDDWVLDLSVREGVGEVWVVQPGSTAGREWRFGLAEGVAYLEDRTAGSPPRVLAEIGPPARRSVAGAPQSIRVVKRGSGVWVEWNGRPLTANPVPLPDRWRGKVGVVAYRSGGEASLAIDALAIRALPYAVRPVAPSPQADDVASLAREAPGIAALSPRWATIEGRAVREVPVDRDLFRMLAQRYAWDIVPTVTIAANASPAGEARTFVDGLPDRLARDGYAGVRFDLAAVRPEALPAWTDAARAVASELRRTGRHVVVASR